MNSRQMHSKAQELAASHIPYNLALRLLAREEELEESRREQSAVPSWLAEVASQLYQACGAYDMPDRVMDVLSDLQGGNRPKSLDILPVHPPQQAQGEAVAHLDAKGPGPVDVQFYENTNWGADLPDGTKFYLAPPAPAAVPEDAAHLLSSLRKRLWDTDWRTALNRSECNLLATRLESLLTAPAPAEPK